MIKVNINLLPCEIKDRQKAEKLVVFAFLGLIAVGVILGSIYSYNLWKIKNAEKEVAQLKEQTMKMQETINQLRVYEQKLNEVKAKQQIVDKAMTGKIEWSKTLEELMIVTPNDVSLTSLSGTSDGITFSGAAIDIVDTPDNGHKPVAKWLVRLAEMTQKPEVWLTSSDKDTSSHAVKFTNTLKFKTTQGQQSSAPPAGK